MTRRIAIVLESHTKRHGDPNAYYDSWSVMEKLLSHAGIDPAHCLVTYLVDRYVDVQTLKWASEEVQQGLQALEKTLGEYQPHFVLLLDRSGYLLRAFSGEKKAIDDWRGSVLLAKAITPGVKTMATFSPKRLTMDYGLTGVVRFDLKRAFEESRTDELAVPTDHIYVDWGFETLLIALHTLRSPQARLDGQRLAVDIEGWCDYVSCIGFATSHNTAFVVPFIRADGTSWWTEEEEVQLWQAVAGVLEDPAVPKVLQNSLYDCFVLAWSYGIVIEGIVDDTMLKHFELFCEMEKSLGFQTSIYTKHPYYKFQRKSDDEKVQLEYCGRDCCRTLECCDAQEAMLKPQQREHYRFNLSLLAPLLYMELRGIRYDKDEAQRRLAATQETIYELQDEINREAARSEGRQKLRAFYEALGVDCGRSTNEVGERPMEANATRLDGLLPLLTSAFCAARRTEVREVTTTTWQPHRWVAGKKKRVGKLDASKAGRMEVSTQLANAPVGRWVQAGKRLPEPVLPEGSTWQAGEEAPGEEWRGTWPQGQWLKPHHTTRLVNVPVAVETLEDVERFTLDSQREVCRVALRIIRSVRGAGACLSPAQRGELSVLLNIHVKVNATNEGGDAQWYLYEHCALPKQYQKEGNKLTTRLASDDEAIIKAYLKSGKDDAKRDPRALVFLQMRRAITQTKFLQAEPDSDGCIRSGMNLVATPTCRMAMYGSPTGTSDLNLQTIGKGLRDLFVADEGCYIGQRDLSNADAYSVAAFSAMLHDPTMLEDLRAKIKPANVLARIYEAGASVNQLTRDQLREECKKVDGEGWLYFACKRVLHGSNYGMGKSTMANQILTDSFKLLGKPIWLEPKACEEIQERAFFVRYPGVRRWHDWMGRELREKGVLVASTGFQRRVFGRKDSHDTLKELLAHFPQYFTTFAIKSTLISLQGKPRQWTDPENRRADGSLRVEPLLLVHDSNVSQWREEDTEFAKTKLAEWFQNEINVAGLTLVIPASGTYGKDWKNQSEAL
jgi:hypothetical protein